MIDVTEDGDDRGTLHEVLRVFALVGKDDRSLRGLLFRRWGLYGESKRLRDAGSDFELDDLVDRDHVSEAHQLLDDIDGVDAHKVGEVGHRYRGR